MNTVKFQTCVRNYDLSGFSVELKKLEKLKPGPKRRHLLTETLHIVLEEMNNKNFPTTFEMLKKVLSVEENLGQCLYENITPVLRVLSNNGLDTENMRIVCQELIKHGAAKTIDKKDDLGDCALHHAVTHSDVEMVEMFLDCGSSIESPNEDGLTPLCVAVVSFLMGVAKLLLKRGADTKVKTRGGKSLTAQLACDIEEMSLDHFYLSDSLLILQELLTRGGSLDEKTSKNLTVRDVLLNKGLLQMVC